MKLPHSRQLVKQIGEFLFEEELDELKVYSKAQIESIKAAFNSIKQVLRKHETK